MCCEKRHRTRVSYNCGSLENALQKVTHLLFQVQLPSDASTRILWLARENPRGVLLFCSNTSISLSLVHTDQDCTQNTQLYCYYHLFLCYPMLLLRSSEAFNHTYITPHFNAHTLILGEATHLSCILTLVTKCQSERCGLCQPTRRSSRGCPPVATKHPFHSHRTHS